LASYYVTGTALSFSFMPAISQIFKGIDGSGPQARGSPPKAPQPPGLQTVNPKLSPVDNWRSSQLRVEDMLESELNHRRKDGGMDQEGGRCRGQRPLKTRHEHRWMPPDS
jgi:hypothetical protein